MTAHKPGTFCWVDFNAKDPNAAKQFYSALFGWTVNEIPLEGGGTYSMMQKNGKTVAAIGGTPPGQENVPPHWNSYVAVENVDAVTNKAATLGGTVAMPPFDVMEAGRMSAVQDPAGAFVFLWQPKEHKGAELTMDAGSVCWNELLTKDTSAAGSFYKNLLGWNVEQFPMDGMVYNIFKHGDTQVGGMFPIDPSWGPVPPNWTVYFAVDDCDATCEKIKSLGGQVLMGPQDIETVGRFATCADPQGGVFAILQPAPRN